MIPVCDIIPTRTPPVVTIALIAVNVLAFSAADSMLGRRSFGEGGSYSSLLLPMLLQVGLIPLLVNVLYLWLFGGAVEDRLGHARFLLLYVAGGLAAAVVQSYLTRMPLVGAATSVSSVLGAYFVMYAKSRVLTLVPFPPLVAEVPVAIFFALWFLFQMLVAFGTVAFAGPVAGFIAGLLLSFLLRRPERARVEWWSP